MRTFLEKLSNIRNSTPYPLRKLVVFGAFTSTFTYAAYKTTESKNDWLRLAFAGSIACMITEMCAFSMDSLNSKMKVHNQTNLTRFVRKMIWEETPSTFFWGMAAAYYGTLFYGLSFFYLYHMFKKFLRPMFSEEK